MSQGYMYILECADGSYYTGSTNNLERRIWEHQNSEGANYTKKRLPVKLIYYEEYPRIDEAFYREKQVQGWSRKKKEALINGKPELLPKLAAAYRDLRNGGLENLSHHKEINPDESVYKTPAVAEVIGKSNTGNVVSRASTTNGRSQVAEALEATFNSNPIKVSNT